MIKVLYRPEVNRFELLTSILSHKDIQLNYLANKMKPVVCEQPSDDTTQKDLYARATRIPIDRKSVSGQEKDEDKLERFIKPCNLEYIPKAGMCVMNYITIKTIIIGKCGTKNIQTRI